MVTQRKISFDIHIYSMLKELNDEDRTLMESAIQARKKAYAPYSNFNVGAALLLENGEVVHGNNQENASYPSGLCAERVAVFYAGAQFPGVKMRAIAISAASKHYEVAQPAAPCGNCRQSISEYEFKQGTPVKLLLMGETGHIIACSSLADLLPLGFNSSFLNK